MSEPIIPNPIPKVVPAIAEKVYGQQYIVETVIEAFPEKPWNVTIDSRPFDGEASVINEQFLIQLKDVKACALLVPQMAEAMAKMIEALGLIAVAARATNVKVINPTNIVQVLAAIEGGE